jgi:hypothetical protein
MIGPGGRAVFSRGPDLADGRWADQVITGAIDAHQPA